MTRNRNRYTIKLGVRNLVQRDALMATWASIAMTAVRFRDDGDRTNARHYANRARMLIDAFGVLIVPRVMSSRRRIHAA